MKYVKIIEGLSSHWYMECNFTKGKVYKVNKDNTVTANNGYVTVSLTNFISVKPIYLGGE